MTRLSCGTCLLKISH